MRSLKPLSELHLPGSLAPPLRPLAAGWRREESLRPAETAERSGDGSGGVRSMRGEGDVPLPAS